MTYTVEVTRENDAWIAAVVDLPGAHTFAKNLTALDAAVREVISLVAELGDDIPIEVDYRYLNLDATALEAARLGERRRALLAQQDRLGLEAVVRAEALIKAGYSVRDISGLLAMSPGRVSQITSAAKGKGKKSA
ncbi:type II toxin-antitoxin system HicB family antitoxin [Homoserinimonas sp. A520]